MKGLRVVNALLKRGRKASSNLRFGRNSCGITRTFSSSASSLVSHSSNIELSYKLYPADNDELDTHKVPLVFLHGLFGAKGNLHSLSKHLSSTGRRVVTFDARNHGSSGHADEMDFLNMAEDLNDLVGQLSIRQPAVMGHSMGGKTAMTYALLHPEGLSSLIAADIAPKPSAGTSTLVDFAHAMKNAVIPQGVGISKARKKVEVQMAPRVPNRSILSFLLTNLVELEDGQVQWRMNVDAFLNNQDAIRGFPTLDFKPFTKPTLFIFGAESPLFKDADQGQIKSLFPAAQIEAIPNAGHFVHSEKPLEFINIVQDFFQNLESKS